MTRSIWGGPDEGPARPPLEGSARADVCVIGAGAAGLSVAYALADAGKEVVLLDERQPGAGESIRTTAHMTSALDMGYAELERLHGPEAARLAAQSHETAIKRVAAIAAREGLDLGLEAVNGYAYTADGRGEGLETELAAARRAGLRVELLERAPLSAFDTGPCLVWPGQAQLDAGLWLRGLRSAVERRGGRIYGRTRAVSVEGGKRARVITSRGLEIRADAIVVATNSPFNDKVSVQSRQAARRTYVVALAAPTGVMPPALLWDDADPYHYIRLAKTPDGAPALLVGGEDHGTGRADDGRERWDRLEDWARERFVTAGPVVARWSGQVVEPEDGLAFIGRSPLDHPNVFLATGHSGNGTTYAAIAGMLLADMILGRRNDWEDVYDHSRVTPGALGRFAARGLETAAQYAAWALPDPVAPNGLSLVCPHLGGRVCWNSAEKSWDCPVHGSRYDSRGRALNGPAPADLEKLG